MYNFAGIVDVPPATQDKLAHITLRRFNEAVMWQARERIGKYTVRETLRNCYDQLHGIMSCEDQEIADALGVDAYINITATKVDIVASFLSEALVQIEGLPWLVKPTPIPDLSEAGMQEALLLTKQQLFSSNFDGDVLTAARIAKDTALKRQLDIATRVAGNMQTKIEDQCSEGGWHSSLNASLYNFCGYPYNVMQGPIPTRKPRLHWNGDSISAKLEIYYEWRNISPFDFWYSPDSRNTQDGTGVFIRERWTRQNLLDAAKMRSYIRENIIKVLEMVDTGKLNRFWLSENPEQNDNKIDFWTHCSATVEVITHYGFFSGRELLKYGVTGLDEAQTYNASITVIGCHCVQVLVTKNPSVNKRPVFTSSFYKSKDRIANSSIPQRVRDVERCYMAVLRYLMSNSYSSSGPITEADFERLSRYNTQEDLANLTPNIVYLTDGSMGRQTDAAFRFYSQPSNINNYLSAMQYFSNKADEVTNIPAALHGTAVGTGANRTFRGLATLQGNAVRAITSAGYNCDIDIFEPAGRLLYNYNMLYEDDPYIKGDSQVQALGTKGLLQKEIDKQNAADTLNIVGSLAGIADQLPPRLLPWAITEVLDKQGVPEEILEYPQ